MTLCITSFTSPCVSHVFFNDLYLAYVKLVEQSKLFSSFVSDPVNMASSNQHAPQSHVASSNHHANQSHMASSSQITSLRTLHNTRQGHVTFSSPITSSNPSHHTNHGHLTSTLNAIIAPDCIYNHVFHTFPLINTPDFFPKAALVICSSCFL